jgi:transcriptional regulator with XRE-family HTH domain
MYREQTGRRLPVVVSDAPTAIRRWIGSELRALRTTRGRKREHVAAHIGKTPQSVGHFETGFSLPGESDLKAILDFLEFPERKEFFTKLRQAAKTGRDWWLYLGEAVPDWFDLYLGVERVASKVESYDAMCVPGLLQTEEYTRAIMREVNPDITDEELEQQIELRRGRQAVLDRLDPGPLLVDVILDEAVLRRPIGGPEVFGRQLDHLLEMGRKNVTIRVIRTSKGGHPGLSGPFAVLTFPTELEPGHEAAGAVETGLAFVESKVRGIYFEDPDEIAVYRQCLVDVRKVADDPAHSAAFIRTIREELIAA